MSLYITQSFLYIKDVKIEALSTSMCRYYRLRLQDDKSDAHLEVTIHSPDLNGIPILEKLFSLQENPPAPTQDPDPHSNS